MNNQKMSSIELMKPLEESIEVTLGFVKKSSILA